VCTRGSNRALLGGPSTSPLEYATRFDYVANTPAVRTKAKTLRLKLQEHARAICKVFSGAIGWHCVCRTCGCA
jgi:hypothetical protein